MKENSREEKVLLQKGVNLSGVGQLYRAFEDYIQLPKFLQESKYSEYQLSILKGFSYKSESPAQAERDIKSAIQILNEWGFKEYSFEGFQEHLLKYNQENKQQQENDLLKEWRQVDDVIPNVKLFGKVQPFFYDKSGLFWFWDKENYCWKLIDEIDLMVALHQKLKLVGGTCSSSRKATYLEAFKRVGRENILLDAPKSWIQFKSNLIDIKKPNRIFGATPKYFLTNPIAWKLGNSSRCPTIDKLFKDWVGETYVETLYEVLAYCCLSDYPIHLAFCLIGSGRNGKTQFQRLVAKFLGERNICATELDTLLGSRFESFKLYKKLVCLLGETNFGVLSKTSLFKKLTGGDLIGFEAKNKKPFDDYSYATILINSNSLPTSEDTSEGFYRRWMIIDFPNEFPEGKDILETIPDEEFENLARKVALTLPRLLERGMFTNQGTIQERRDKYIMASNPLPVFIKEHCNLGTERFILSTDLYNAYTEYLHKNKKRKVSRKEFNTGLSEEGLFVRKCEKKIGDRFVNGYFLEGIELKDNWRYIFI